MPDIDWAAIRRDYEQGRSLRSLEKQYPVTRPAIAKHAKKEGWQAPDMPIVSIPYHEVSTLETFSEPDVDPLLGLVNDAITDLARHLDNHLELKEHKLLADALSQYVKIKLSLPGKADQTSQVAAFDIRDLLASATDDELELLRPVIKNVQARIDEQQEKIRPIKKIG